MTTEVHLSAIDDEDALKIFNKIDLKKGFSWRDDGIRKSRATYEVTNVQNTDKSISSSGKSGEKS
jgi:adenylate cyclase class IV